MRYTVQPDVLAAAAVRPQVLEAIYDREVLMWIERLDQQGYTLVSKPSAAQSRVCLDWKEPQGSRWMVVEARFYHHGNIGIIREADMEAMKAHQKAIGAEKPQTSAGVGEWLENQRADVAAQAVIDARPRKERDDDFD